MNSPLRTQTRGLNLLLGLLLVSSTSCASAPTNAIWPADPSAAGLEPSSSSPQFGYGRDFGQGRFPESRIFESPFSIDTHLGIRVLNDDDNLDELERQPEVGVSILIPLVFDDPRRLEDTRVGFLSVLSLDFGLRYAFESSDTTDGSGVLRSLDSETFDAHVGLFASPFQYTSRFQPYLGGGLAFVFFDTDLNTSGTIQNERDSVLTGYVRTGAQFVIDYGRRVGIDVRFLSDADVEIDGLGADVGALSVSLTFGASF